MVMSIHNFLVEDVRKMTDRFVIYKKCKCIVDTFENRLIQKGQNEHDHKIGYKSLLLIEMEEIDGACFLHKEKMCSSCGRKPARLSRVIGDMVYRFRCDRCVGSLQMV